MGWMAASGRSPLKAAPPVHSQVSRERTITITSELAPIVVIRCLAMRAGHSGTRLAAAFFDQNLAR